jgi:hypothetical protein
VSKKALELKTTAWHAGSKACGDYVRRNTGATVIEARIPPALAVGSVSFYKFSVTEEN